MDMWHLGLIHLLPPRRAVGDHVAEAAARVRDASPHLGAL